MSDWESPPTSKVTNNNIKSFAAIDGSGYAGGGDYENPTTNLKLIDQDLARKDLHPVARQALTEARAALTTKAGSGWESPPAGTPSAAGGNQSTGSDAGWESPTQETKGPAVPFKSGQAFHDTLEIPENLKKATANHPNESLEDTFYHGLQNAGSAIWDTVAALPAMVVGGAHGIYEGIKQGDATAGLKTGMETMHGFMPSTLANKMVPNFSDTKSVPYQALMAPVTGLMDTMNAIPTGFAEMLNAAGFSDAAAQLDAGGKMALMTVLGAKGAKEAYKALTGIDARTSTEAAEKLEKLRATADKAQEASKQSGAHDKGIPGTVDEPQGQLFSEKEPAPTTPIPNEAQGEMFGDPSLKGNEIPYDLSLGEVGANHPGLDRDTMNQRMEKGPQFPTPLEDSSRQLNMESAPDRMSLVPKESEKATATAPEPRPILDSAGEKAAELSAQDQFVREQAANKQREIEASYGEVDRQKNMDYGKIKGEEQLAFAESVRQIEERNQHRLAFLDKDNFDWQHAKDVIKDATLMDKGRTIEMRGHMRRGDVKSALAVLAEHHPDHTYRELARYLSDKVEGLSIKLHDESTIKMGERDVTGYYDPQNHMVGLSGLGATSPHTVLHELTHAVTSHFINTNPKDMRVTGLKALFKAMVNERGMKEFPGIVNVKEFVAEAFSNPKFQEFLKGSRMNNKTVWRRFVDNVKSILGLSGENGMVNAFEHAMDLGKQVIEAQTGKGEVRETLTRAGMTNKLADLMAQAPRDPRPEIVRNGAVRTIAGGIPGLEHAVSDFAHYDKPIGEIVEMARAPNDIPNTKMEKFAQQMQGGALFESLKTRNPVVKYAYERITRAFQEASHNVKENLTNPETGIKKYMRDLNPDEKGEIHAVMMMHEGQRELTSTELANAGMNEKQIALYNKQRELDNQFYEAINERRAEMGLRPMDKRVAHIAGRFMGDFAQMVFKDVINPKTGAVTKKVVGRISGKTNNKLLSNDRWNIGSNDLNHIAKFMKEEHPEWEFGPVEYNAIGKGAQAKDRFAGLMEAINFLEKSDSDTKVLMDSYRAYMQKDAVNYLNATRHAKAKVKEAGGIVGSEGHKEWKSAVENAEEGMKAQLSYFEQGYQWMAMEKAVGDLKKVLGDEEVVKNNPNAVEYSKKYLDHAMGRNQGVFSDAANTLLSQIGKQSGFGHSNLMALNGTVKHLIMQKFMGLGNIPFTITQLSQPFQTVPAMSRMLAARGLEFSAINAQKKALETYLVNMTEPHGIGRLNDFERSAINYADQMSIFDVKMADHTKDINASAIKEGYDKLADLNITAPEHITRGTTFLFYAHALKDAGIPARDIFSAAENMTNMSMVNYHRIERPMGYAKLGWIGDVASTLTRYKHNQYSQLAMYAREGGREGGYSPLATFVGTSLAFGGIMGFFAYQEADAIYQLFSEHVLRKPDSLTNHVLGGSIPSAVSHGMFSMLGMDMTTRFSNANLLPNSIPEALMPYGSAVWDIAQTTGRFLLDPANTFKAKQLAKSLAPQSMQGLMENKLFTEKDNQGRNLYINSTDGPNLGKGRIDRSDSEMNIRAFGFRSLRESKELAKNYSDSQIEKQHANIVDKLQTKARYDILGNKASDESLKALAEKAAAHGEDPAAFVGKLASWGVDRQLTQSQQQLLRNAQKGYKGAFNIKEGAAR